MKKTDKQERFKLQVAEETVSCREEQKTGQKNKVVFKREPESLYVYDFDKTIYDGDVTYDFYKYCFKRFVKVRKYFFVQLWAIIKYLLGFYKWTQFKEKMLGYLKKLDEIDLVVQEFWEQHKKKLKKWYLEKDHSQDVVISASPEFLLEKICCEYLHVKMLIGTKASKKTGAIIGKNCYGNQKVERLNQKIQNYKIKEFYSDSLSDEPLAKLAERSYLVQKDNLINWQDYKLPTTSKLKMLFFSRDFILFILIGVINTFNSVVFSMFFRFLRLGKLTAFCCGFVLGTFIAYLLNNFIIFKEKFLFKRYLKVFVSYIPNLLIQLVVVFVMCKVYNLPDIVAYLSASVIGVPVSFLFVRLFAFQPTNQKKINFYQHKEE